MAYQQGELLSATHQVMLTDVIEYHRTKILPPDQQKAFDDLMNGIRAVMTTQSALFPMERLREFVENMPPPGASIVQGFLEPQTCFCISGSPKAGKSFLAMQMAWDIALGGKMFGQWEILKPGPVVYLMLEGDKSQQIRAIKRNALSIDPPIHVIRMTASKEKIDLTRPDHIRCLIDTVSPLDPSMLVVDTARHAFPIDDWNDASLIQSKIGPFMQAVSGSGVDVLPTGMATTMLHHNNKNSLASGGDRISGSNAFTALMDAYMVISTSKRLDNGDLHIEASCNGRMDIPDSMVFQMDTETLTVRAVEEADIPAAKRAAESAHLQRYYALLYTHLANFPGGMTITELTKAVEKNRDLVRSVVKAMEADGKIVKVDKRTSVTGGAQADVYALPADDTAFAR